MAGRAGLRGNEAETGECSDIIYRCIIIMINGIYIYIYTYTIWILNGLFMIFYIIAIYMCKMHLIDMCMYNIL